jgi:hypothetical protein
MDGDGRLERAAIEAAKVIPPGGNRHCMDYFRAIAAAVLAVADDVALSAPGALVKGPDSGSPTSRAASLANLPRRGTQRWEVLELFRLRQPGVGFTRDELVAETGWPPNVVTPRVKELVDGGWLVPLYVGDGQVKTRRTLAGQLAEVLILSAAGHRRLGL